MQSERKQINAWLISLHDTGVSRPQPANPPKGLPEEEWRFEKVPEKEVGVCLFYSPRGST